MVRLLGGGFGWCVGIGECGQDGSGCVNSVGGYWCVWSGWEWMGVVRV